MTVNAERIVAVNKLCCLFLLHSYSLLLHVGVRTMGCEFLAYLTELFISHNSFVSQLKKVLVKKYIYIITGAFAEKNHGNESSVLK